MDSSRRTFSAELVVDLLMQLTLVAFNLDIVESFCDEFFKVEVSKSLYN